MGYKAFGSWFIGERRIPLVTRTSSLTEPALLSTPSEALCASYMCSPTSPASIAKPPHLASLIGIVVYSKSRIASYTHNLVSQTQLSASYCTAADAMSLSISPSQIPRKSRTPSWEVRVHRRRFSFPCKTQSRSPITPAALCIRTSLGGVWYKNRRAKILFCLCVDIDSKPQGVCFYLLIRAKSIRPRFTEVISISLNKECNEPSMCDEDNIVVYLRELFQAFSNLLSAYSGSLYSVWWMIPFFWTFWKVQMWKRCRNIGARDALVANSVVGFAQVGPDLYFSPVWGWANRREGVHGSLDGTCHGWDDDKIWDGRDLNLLCGFVPCIRQGWIKVGVAAINVMEGLSVTDDMN